MKMTTKTRKTKTTTRKKKILETKTEMKMDKWFLHAQLQTAAVEKSFTMARFGKKMKVKVTMPGKRRTIPRRRQ